MSEKLNVYQRVNLIRNDVGAIQKRMVGSGKWGYKAMMSDDVVGAVREASINHGVIIYISHIDEAWGQIEAVRNDGKVSKANSCNVKLEVTFQNVDDPIDHFKVFSLGTGLDPSDKAPGKAITYAYKYALLKTLMLLGGDDPDATHSRDTAPVKGKPGVVTDEGLMQAIIPMLKQHRADLVDLDPAYKQEIMTALIAKARGTDMSSASIMALVKKYDDIPFSN